MVKRSTQALDAPADRASGAYSVAPREQRSGGPLANTDAQRAIAEVQAAMMIARANPRNELLSRDRILNACSRPGLADAAIYSYSRGGQEVTGPSIRLAEALAQAWGNVQFGIRELEQRDGESTVQSYAWDVETNTRREVTFQVSHIRHTKQGAKLLTDPRDIYEMVANQGARRLRACVLSIIPGDVVEDAVVQCEATMRTNADTSPDAVQRIEKAFAEFGVTKEQIERRIQRRLDTIQPAQIVALKKVYASLRDGMSKPAEWFDQTAESGSATSSAGSSTAPPAAADPVDALRSAMAQRQQAEGAAPAAPAAPAADVGSQPSLDMGDGAPAP